MARNNHRQGQRFFFCDDDRGLGSFMKRDLSQYVGLKPSHFFWPLISSVDSVLFSLAVCWGLFLKSPSVIKDL